MQSIHPLPLLFSWLLYSSTLMLMRDGIQLAVGVSVAGTSRSSPGCPIRWRESRRRRSSATASACPASACCRAWRSASASGTCCRRRTRSRRRCRGPSSTLPSASWVGSRAEFDNLLSSGGDLVKKGTDPNTGSEVNSNDLFIKKTTKN